ncbi:MAG: hypothetical protein WBG92_00230 [Thiohalocapsa sp.]
MIKAHIIPPNRARLHETASGLEAGPAAVGTLAELLESARERA